MDSNYYTPACMSNFYRQPNTGSQPSYYQPGNSMNFPASQMMPTYPLPAIGTTLPTGMPAGSNLGPPPAVSGPIGEMAPMTVQDTMYVPGYLKTQIGRRVRVEFLIGTNGTTDRTGTLLGVGASYILIRPSDSDDVILCDLYSIKFVTFFY